MSKCEDIAHAGPAGRCAGHASKTNVFVIVFILPACVCQPPLLTHKGNGRVIMVWGEGVFSA